jgi:hypothetical protein
MTHAGYCDFAFERGHNAAERKTVAGRAGVLRRVLDALRASRQRQIDRDIASLIAGRGGRITDDLEREITRRLLTSDWNARG